MEWSGAPFIHPQNHKFTPESLHWIRQILIWASLRGQTLYKTVRGVSNIRNALSTYFFFRAQ